MEMKKEFFVVVSLFFIFSTAFAEENLEKIETKPKEEKVVFVEGDNLKENKIEKELNNQEEKEIEDNNQKKIELLHSVILKKTKVFEENTSKALSLFDSIVFRLEKKFEIFENKSFDLSQPKALLEEAKVSILNARNLFFESSFTISSIYESKTINKDEISKKNNKAKDLTTEAKLHLIQAQSLIKKVLVILRRDIGDLFDSAVIKEKEKTEEKAEIKETEVSEKISQQETEKIKEDNKNI